MVKESAKRIYVCISSGLLEYRIHDGQISCYGSKEQEKFNILTRRNMLKLLEVQLDPDEERQFAHMNTSCMSPESVIGLFDKILHANQEKSSLSSVS